MNSHHFTIKERRGRRWFLHVRKGGEMDVASGPELIEASVEAYIASGARHTGLSLSFGSTGVKVFAGISHVTCGWFTLKSPWLFYKRLNKRLLPRVNVVDLRLHDRAVWWEVWHPKDEWKSGTPRWRSGNFQWFDALAGKPEYSTVIVEGPVEVGIPMPEGTYRALVTMEDATWRRKRWWSKTVRRAQVDILSRPAEGGGIEDAPDGRGYIPEPGKGENSWDCGPDGTFSVCMPAVSVPAAIGQTVSSCLATRVRRGARLDYAEPIA